MHQNTFVKGKQRGRKWKREKKGEGGERGNAKRLPSKNYVYGLGHSNVIEAVCIYEVVSADPVGSQQRLQPESD